MTRNLQTFLRFLGLARPERPAPRVSVGQRPFETRPSAYLPPARVLLRELGPGPHLTLESILERTKPPHLA